MVYRGCADYWNLPWRVDPDVNCTYQGQKPSLWWFCKGDLCNRGKFGTEDICKAEDSAWGDDGYYGELPSNGKVAKSSSHNDGGDKPHSTMRMVSSQPTRTILTSHHRTTVMVTSHHLTMMMVTSHHPTMVMMRIHHPTMVMVRIHYPTMEKVMVTTRNQRTKSPGRVTSRTLSTRHCTTRPGMTWVGI